MQYIRTFQDAERNAALRMRDLGFVDAKLTSDGADGGVDVVSVRALAQVKWRGAAVSRDELQKLFGARGSCFDRQLLFFAASEYSKPAVEYANAYAIALFIYEPYGELVPRNPVAAQLASARRIATASPVAARSSIRSPGDGRSSCDGDPADFTRLRFVRSADVYKAGRLAGSLERAADGRIEFRYTPDYLDSAGNRVAATLPLGTEPVDGGIGTVPSFFAGLLPEGDRLVALRGAVRTAVDDELSLLLAVGADTPGDVQIFAADANPADVPALADGRSAEELEFDRLVNDVDRHALPGAQNKASA